MSLSLKIALNTGIQIVGRGLKIVINIGLVYCLTRLLGPEGMGRYETIFTYVAFFELIADMGLNTIITKWVSRNEERATNIISNILGIRFVLSMVMVVLVLGSLSLFPQYSLDERYGIILASISSVALLFNAIMMGIFQVKLTMEKQVTGDLIGGIVTLILVVFVWVLRGNLLLVVLARVIGNIVWFLVTLYYGRKFFTFTIRFETQVWREILHEALPIGLAILFWRVYYKADILLLRFLPIPSRLESNETLVGIYSVAFKIFDLLVSIAGMFMVATFPILAKYAFSDRQRFLSIYQKSFNFLLLLAFPMVVAVTMLASKLILTFADERFAEAGYLLQILTCAAFFSFFNSLNNGAVVSLNKHLFLMVLNIVSVVFNIFINLWAIPRFAHVGAAYTTLLTEIVVFVASFYILKTAQVPLPRLTSLGTIVFASMVMAGALYLTSALHLFINLAVAGLSFFGVLLLVNPGIFRTILSDLSLTSHKP